MSERDDVSILVVLDEALEPVQPPSSCYNDAKVSILVVLDEALERHYNMLDEEWVTGFQSLLFWMKRSSLSFFLSRSGAGLCLAISLCCILAAENLPRVRKLCFEPLCARLDGRNNLVKTWVAPALSLDADISVAAVAAACLGARGVREPADLDHFQDLLED